MMIARITILERQCQSSLGSHSRRHLVGLILLKNVTSAVASCDGPKPRHQPASPPPPPHHNNSEEYSGATILEAEASALQAELSLL